MDSGDVGAVLEHLLRAGPGRLGRLCEGAPLPRRHTIQACLANGAAPRLPWERLPA